MKNLLAVLLSGALIAASGTALAASPGTTGYCYDAQGKKIACAPQYEGRSQATQPDGIDPLWAGAGVLVAGGGLAAGLALSNSGNDSTPFFPFAISP